MGCTYLSKIPTISSNPHTIMLLLIVGEFGYPEVVMDIRYFSYFLSLYLLDKETQCNTYLNPCSKFTLNFLDSIYSQMTPFRERSFLLELEPLFSDYASFSNYDRGYADLSKRLWLCMSKRTGVFSHLFLYCFLLRYYIKIHKTLEIQLDTFLLNLLESYQ